MNVTKNIWPILSVVIGVLGVGVAIFVGWYSNREKPTIVQIQKVCDVELTRPLPFDGLTSSYMYKDSIPVEHLWQSTFMITNTGETTILGEGFATKSIKGDALNLSIKNCNSLLAMNIDDSVSDFSIHNSQLKFSQWQPQENIKVTILSDGPTAPQLTINEKDICNAEVVYIADSIQIAVKSRLMDRLPRSLERALWWVTIVVWSVMFVYMIYAFRKSVKDAKTAIEKGSAIFVWIVALGLLFAPLLWMF